MKTINYKSLWRTALYVYNSVFWIIAAIYCMVIPQNTQIGSLKSMPIGFVLLIPIMSVLLATIVASLSKFLLKETENLQAKQFILCCLVLTFWYLPLTIPGTIHVIIDSGSYANILGSIIVGFIFFLIPSIFYLRKLRHLCHSSAINLRINNYLKN